jgi:hypothetical protein
MGLAISTVVVAARGKAKGSLTSKADVSSSKFGM